MVENSERETFPDRSAGEYRATDNLKTGRNVEFQIMKIPPHPLNFDALFSLVRKSVRMVLRKERSGVGLILSALPPEVGAFWEVGSNYIVLNEVIVSTMKETTSPLEYNSFVFVILAHEYLHSLGILDEAEVRKVTAHVALNAFGESSLVTRMAQGDLWEMYPLLRMLPGKGTAHIQVVRNFAREDTASYIR